MKRFSRVLMSVLLCSILALSAGARPAATRVALPQGSELTVIVDGIDMSRYEENREVQAYVTVRAPQIGVIEDLAVENFTLQISGGSLFTPDFAEMETTTVSMGIVLELYQTMLRNDGFQKAKEAISNLCLNQKAVEDSVAVFGVRQGVDPDSRELDAVFEHEYTIDGGAIHNFVQDLQIERTPPGTPLYDTIIKAMRYTVQVSRQPVGRRGIIIITDGGDRGSRNTADVVVDAARNLRIPVYTIGYTGGGAETEQQIQFLNELANRTGGSYRNTPDSEQFSEFLGELREELMKHYVLTFKVDTFETNRQILNVRVDYSNMAGSDSLTFDVNVRSTTPVDPTPETAPEETDAPDEPGTPDDPEETPTDIEDDAQTFLDDLLEWIEDNVLYVAIGGGLLLLFLIVAVVLLRKKKPTPASSGYYPPPESGWDAATDDWASPSAGGSTISGAAEPTAVMGGAEPTAMAGGADAWGTPTPYHDEGMPQQGARGAVPAYPDSSQPYPPQPPRQPAPPPRAGAPADGGTVVLSRAPKMEHEALLIDRRANRTYELTKPEMRLGRSAENEIPLDSEKVSRRHALIVLTGVTFYIQDLGSANGTFVNGEQVRDRAALHNGDEVRLGDRTFVFQQLS